MPVEARCLSLSSEKRSPVLVLDEVPLGHYPDDHFTEEIPLKLVKDFQKELRALSAAIQARNENLEIPYTHMDPARLENSVTI